MKRILVTGATGNTGYQVIRYLFRRSTSMEVFAGVRDIERATHVLGDFSSGLQYVHFDFEHPQTYDSALQNVDAVFLIRPPHISNVKKTFHPLIKKMREKGIREVIFLSVQGAGNNSFIPHHKIENEILKQGLDYIFLRPGYFMQNLLSTLYPDIHHKRSIVLPAGKALFNWIDVENIAEAAAILLDRFGEYKNNAFDLTGYQNLSFPEVASLITRYVSDEVRYIQMDPVRFFLMKRREHQPAGMIWVMIMLHFLPRFSKGPVVSSFYEELTGNRPNTLEEFIARERKKLEPAG